MNRQQLLDKIDAGRRELETLLAQAPLERMLEPALPNGWSLKDVLAHFEGWALHACYVYACLAAGDEPQDAITNADDYNAKLFAANQNRRLEEVLSAEQSAFRKLRAIAESAPDADLFDAQRFTWTQGKEFHHWIAWNSDEHYAEHLPDLRAWLGSL